MTGQKHNQILLHSGKKHRTRMGKLLDFAPMGACGAGQRPAPSFISKGGGYLLGQHPPRALFATSRKRFNFQGGGIREGFLLGIGVI